jgi:hypothetical protein
MLPCTGDRSIARLLHTQVTKILKTAGARAGFQLSISVSERSDTWRPPGLGTFQIQFQFYQKKKSKAVPLLAMVAHGGRGGIAPTHS